MKIVLTRRAARQLAELLGYIRERNPEGAGKVQKRIQGALTMLAEYSEAGALTDEPETRRVVVNPYPYAIFYQIRENTLIIERIRHTARRPS